MTRITKITTGFLSGNLCTEAGYDEVVSAEKYAALLHRRLTEAFPDVEIEVRFQRASGATPYSLRTHVYYEGDDADTVQDDAVSNEVDRIRRGAYETPEAWMTEA